MKKKMVTMLLIGVMAVMTACGTASKNNTVSDTTTVETDENVKEDKSENDTKKDDAEVVSVDDVKFNDIDVCVNGGSTYNIVEKYTSETSSSTIESYENNTYEYNGNSPIHVVSTNKKIRNNVIEEEIYDRYYDNLNDIIYNSSNDIISKKNLDYHISGEELITVGFEEVFKLPWTFETETNDNYIFTLDNNTDFSNLYYKFDMIYEDTTIDNLNASYIYSKDGTKLQTINLSFDINKNYANGTEAKQTYSFSLTSSNLGNTLVEIPEDIINNAVEE